MVITIINSGTKQCTDLLLFCNKQPKKIWAFIVNGSSYKVSDELHQLKVME